MNLFKHIRRWRRHCESHVPARPPRAFGFEKLERRDLLSADPLNFGAVYYEDALAGGTDNVEPGDLMHISFHGGVDGTQLDHLTIELDPDAAGLFPEGRFFDTAAGGLGASGHLPLSIVENHGIDQVSFAVNSSQLDGTTTLTISFQGFDSGDQLVLGFDVDEMDHSIPTPTVEGIEFEGSTITGTFTAPTYYDSQLSVTFHDQFNLSGMDLNLPPDSYIPPGAIAANDYTAGGAASTVQQSLPVTISGTVYDDADGDNVLDAGEHGIGDVHLDLQVFQDGHYVSTGLSATTDADGHYEFHVGDRGEYRVVESQPTGYESIGATAGHVGPDTRGFVLNPDVITDVSLVGGEHSIENNFAEFHPSSIDGFVYHDRNNDGVMDVGEEGISGVTLHLVDADGHDTGISAITDIDGSYHFDGLHPGTYGVAEVHPAGYLDGLDTAGTAGGLAHNPGDLISDIVLTSGTHGEGYKFGELLPGSISGQIHADDNGNCILDPGESPLAGVTVQLLDGDGHIIDTTVTSDDGTYLFDNLAPGTYGVHEVQPGGLLDGDDHVGTAGGVLSADDTVTEIALGSDVHAVGYNFCEVQPASLSGVVYQDGATILVDGVVTSDDLAAIRDGVFTPDDTPIAGVTLQLTDTDGNPVLDAHGDPLTAVTDAAGVFHFDNLYPGEYTLTEVQPDGYLDWHDTAGTAGGTADNPGDAIHGITLAAGQNATDYHFSELQLADKPPVLPPPPPLPPLPPLPPGIPPTTSGFGAIYVFAGPVTPLVIIPPGPFHLESVAVGGGSGGIETFTWHLSIVDGGHPRGESDIVGPDLPITHPVRFRADTWTGSAVDEGQFLLHEMGEDGAAHVRSLTFGMTDGIPVVGDFNGDGLTEVGVYHDGYWFIDLNGNGKWDRDDMWAHLGRGDDKPVTGDWDGDGKTDIAVFGPSWQGDGRALLNEAGLPGSENVTHGVAKNLPPEEDHAPVMHRRLKCTAGGEMREDVIDHVFEFGHPGDEPVAGDWNGDGLDQIGVYRNGTFLLDANGNGRWDLDDVQIEAEGIHGTPVVGDFDNDGIDEVGLVHGNTWYIDANGDGRLDALDRVFELEGGHGGAPIVGDFNGDGRLDMGYYQDGSPARVQR